MKRTLFLFVLSLNNQCMGMSTAYTKTSLSNQWGFHRSNISASETPTIVDNLELFCLYKKNIYNFKDKNPHFLNLILMEVGKIIFLNNSKFFFVCYVFKNQVGVSKQRRFQKF